jgi:tetratricopeptide (TPR) repeat protein
MCRKRGQETGSDSGKLRAGGAVQRGMNERFAVLLWPILAAIAMSGCAGSRPNQATTPDRVVEMDELRITAARDAQGYRFDVYDVGDLFKRATDLLNQQKCREAVELYDRLVSEFATHRYASAALYNAGLCLQALGDFAGAAQRYTVLRERFPDSEDRKDASFQLAEVLVQLERWPELMAVADELLARTDLISAERLEAMARRGQALLGQGNTDEAERYARSALSYFRTRPPEDAIKDDFFAAACNYVLAESFRQREQAMQFPQGVEAQKQVLLKRAELLLEAQREYFNTISLNNLDNYYWAAASGYRIGNMYDELWHAVMNSPVPANLPPEGHDIYHQELAKLIKPLIRHAIRYWELTQMFIERTGIQTAWAGKIKTDLDRVRALLLEQPAGPGGVPAAPAAAATKEAQSAPNATAGAAPPKPPAARRHAAATPPSAPTSNPAPDAGTTGLAATPAPATP